MQVCVPCNDNDKPNMPAHRLVSIPGVSGTVPMCDMCWNQGTGPGMKWRPGQKEDKPKPAAPAPPLSPGRPRGAATGGQEGKAAREMSTEERNRKMQADRDAGMTVMQIAEKYNISVSSVGVYTRAPKNAVPAPRPAKPDNRKPIRKTDRKADSDGTDFDAIIEKLEAKKITIDAAIEAVKAARDLVAELGE
jgi:transposase